LRAHSEWLVAVPPAATITWDDAMNHLCK